MSDSVIFHIDVNSAFLSWEACYRINVLGETEDIRLIPSAIGGNEETRHGIVLAKSTPAKKFGLVTGEPMVNARRKCPNLKVFAPNFPYYVKCSNAFISLLKEYSPVVDQFSIDEAFCDFTGTRSLYGDPVDLAHRLKDQIRDELGFTVNIGISCNKLLSKMASDFQKPDRVHTLFPDEISTKMWPLPVSDLLFVGKSSVRALHNLGIFTIGDLAHADQNVLNSNFGKHGAYMWQAANGIDDGSLKQEKPANKGYGNSITLKNDVTDLDTAHMILLSLCETVGARIRADQTRISVVAVNCVDADFHHFSHQTTLSSPTDITEKIYETVKVLFSQCWDGSPLRLLGVQTSKANADACVQYNLFDSGKSEKLSKLNSAIDEIRNKFGEESVQRACFIDSSHNHMTGGLHKAKRESNPEH